MIDRRLEPADVIDEVLTSWKPGTFETPRELAQTAMTALDIPRYVDISLEALASDLLENDNRLYGAEAMK